MLLLDEPTNHLDAESRSRGSSDIWPSSREPSWRSRTIGTSSTTSRAGSSSSIAAREFRTRATTLVARAEAHAAGDGREAGSRRASARSSASSSGCGCRRARVRRRARRASRSTRSWRAAAEGEKVMQNEIVIPPPPRLGNDVVIAKGLKKAYGDKVLFDDLSFSLPRGGIVGIIGAERRGQDDAVQDDRRQGEAGRRRSLKVGETVQLAYVDQTPRAERREHGLQGSERRATTSSMVGKREMQTRAYLAQFNFKGADQQKKVEDLSGGERNRLHLAKLLKSGGNLLLLDEPTNDLDVDTLRALEEALVDFPGCAVVISHDRWFLDRIATHILAFEGNSETVWFEGYYRDYAEDFKKRKGADADQPHRIAYRKLVHR